VKTQIKLGLVLEHYTEIFERTSELTDCAFADKFLSVRWICDERGWFLKLKLEINVSDLIRFA